MSPHSESLGWNNSVLRAVCLARELLRVDSSMYGCGSDLGARLDTQRPAALHTAIDQPPVVIVFVRTQYCARRPSDSQVILPRNTSRSTRTRTPVDTVGWNPCLGARDTESVCKTQARVELSQVVDIDAPSPGDTMADAGLSLVVRTDNARTSRVDVRISTCAASQVTGVRAGFSIFSPDAPIYRPGHLALRLDG